MEIGWARAGVRTDSRDRMRRRVQGEDARCFVPWAGHGPTPHEPSPARPREGRAGRIAAPRAAAPNLAIRRRPREDRWPLIGAASPLDELGQTNIRSLRRRLRARAARPAPRPAPPHAPEALAGPERGSRADPPHRGRLNPPKALQAPLPRLGRARERPPPAKLPEEPRQPGSERRSRAGRERRSRRRTRRRAGPPNPSSRRRNEARAASRHRRRAATPVTGPPLSGSLRAAWTTPTEPGARGPMPGESFTPAGDPALSRGQQALRHSRKRTSRKFGIV